MIPLVSSMCTGPLGTAHLPRLWWKNLLYACGQLDPDYPHCTGGLDLNVLQLLKLDRDETLAFLHGEKPDYLQFEAWVETHGTVHPVHVERWNRALLHRTHLVAKIDEIYADLGWDKDTETESSAVLLNGLQDWQLFHSSDLHGGLNVAMPPMLSSIDRGPLGVCQLPRTWLKVCLRARQLLHSDYPDCADGSLDQRCLLTLGVDQDAALAYLRQHLPTYLEFEAWVRDNGTIDLVAIAEFNERLLTREHIPAKLADIHSTLGREQTWVSGVLLNHLEDWHYAHAALVST